jgi:gamma-glutamylcyclotransferase (GGCT)/AIG2-like uncharacterized protein YtfP
MTQNPDYLFVYGTLRPPFTNSSAMFLRQNSQFVSEVTFAGLLFDLGNYPGAIYQADAETRVQGTLYNIGAKKSTLLDYLDDYEGTGSDYPVPHEYVRSVIPVWLDNDWVDCWIYLFNLSTNGKLAIASGDYVAYSKKE